MNEIKYRAVKYIRLSNADDKPGESDSVTNQRKLIDEWLKNHPEIEVVSEKVDDGWSGLLFDRPAFKEMMEDIKEGKINCCITKDLSRLGREYIEMGRYLRQIFPAYGVRFIAINDSIDTLNDKGDDLTVGLKSLMNDAYCRDISIKTRSALDIKRVSGDYIGATPVYGYIKSPENRNKLIPDNYAANIVRDIFRMKIDGIAAARIADYLNERGILSPYQYKKDRGLPHPHNGFADKENAKWSAKTIIRILQDRTYTGALIQGKFGTPNYKLKKSQQKPQNEWRCCKNTHEAIVSEIDFELVQRLLKLDTRTSPTKNKVYIFSGLVICGCCGNRMIRKSAYSKGKQYFYYWCPTTKKGGCADSAKIKEDELTACAFQSIRGHVSNIAALETIISDIKAEEVGQKLAENLSEQLSENERKLVKIREFEAGLYENMISDNLSKDEFKSLKAQYIEDADNLKAANERLKIEIDDALSCKHERLLWIEHFKKFENAEYLDRKTVVALIKSFKIKSNGEIEIEFNFKSEYETALALIKKGVA